MRTPGLFICCLALALGSVLTSGHQAGAAGGSPTVNGLALSVTAMSLTTSSSLSNTQSVPSAAKMSAPSKISAPAKKMAMSVAPATFQPQALMMTSPATFTPTPSGPQQTTSNPTTANSTSNPVGPQPTYAVVDQRPDFYYNPPALNFVASSSYNTGQIGMAVGPGLQPGMVRYVPVGEF